MKKLLLSFLIISGVLAAKEVILKKPPESLRKYYPPQSEKFEFLNNMHTMSNAFYAVQLNINEGNWEKANEWAKRLVETYKKTAEMVPEWKKYYDFKKADDYLRAVQSRNPDSVIKAARELGRTCAKCHEENEIAVKIYYRFPDFSKIKVEDPVDLTKYDLKEFMVKLTRSMQAMNVYLSQNQPDKAREHGMNFVERARATKELCSKCHTDKKDVEAITGKDYDEALKTLESLLNTGKPDPSKVRQATAKISMSCYTCHNVHYIPAKIKTVLSK